MFGYIKGYDISDISKRKAKKEGFGLSLNSIVSNEVLRNDVLEAIKNGGKVYGLYKKKEMIACYVFTKEKVDSAEINQPTIDLNKENMSKIIQGKTDEVSTENSNEVLKDKETTVLKLSGKYILPQHADVTQEFEKTLLAELKEYVVMGEIKAVIWEENILVATQIKVGALGTISGIGFGISIGFLFGLIFDNIAIGICLGMLWAMSFGTLFRTINSNTENKKSDNKKTDDKSVDDNK